MKSRELKEKRDALLAETLESLRHKPVNSTCFDRLRVSAEASDLYRHLPRPLYIGNAMLYTASHVEIPIKDYDILFGRLPEKLLTEDEETLYQSWCDEDRKGNLFMCDSGHTSLDWEEIIRLGLSGYAEKCAAELRRRQDAGDDPKRINFLEGFALVYSAYQTYIERCADKAEKMGNAEGAALCRNIAHRPPETFREAMQLVLFVGFIFSAYSSSGNATLCLGRMDDYLADIYKRDIESGRLTEEEAGCIIDDFCCKWALPIGRGEHQMSGGGEFDTGWSRNPMYDSPTYIILGGYSNHRDHNENPLTRLFLEHIHPRLENPVFVFRRTADTPDEIWSLVCDKLRQNSSLLVYNDETMIKSMEFAGVDSEDAVNYTIHGCNWPDIQGLNTYCTAGQSLAITIMKSVFGEDGRPVKHFKSIDEIYEKIGEDYRAFARKTHEALRRPKNGSLPSEDFKCADAFKRGLIEEATSAVCGVKYYFILHKFRNVGTGADIMSALDCLLFGENPVDIETLADALAADFEGYPDIYIRCKKAPKYGHDDDGADRHAKRLVNLLCDIVKEESVDKETGKHFVNAPCVTITDMFYIGEGRELGATPDGRRAGSPFSENLSPSRGQSESVTALINSVTCLPFEKLSSGALNIRLSRSQVEGDEGLCRLKVLLDVYFRKGGMQAQLSITDADELRAAQADPDAYRDLMVRITGYSAVFVDMSNPAQEEIIARESLA